MFLTLDIDGSMTTLNSDYIMAIVPGEDWNQDNPHFAIDHVQYPHVAIMSEPKRVMFIPLASADYEILLSMLDDIHQHIRAHHYESGE